MISSQPDQQPEQAPAPHPYGNIDIGGLVPLNIATAIRSPRDVLDFVLPGLLAGSMAVMVGPGGVSKSMLALQTAAVIATGTDHWHLWSDGDIFPSGRVAVFNLEDPPIILGTRIHDIGNSIPPGDQQAFTDQFNTSVNIWPLVGRGFAFATKSLKTGAVRPSEWVAWMEDQVKGCRLAIIDTFIRGLAGLDENSSTDISLVLGLLEIVVRRTGCAVLILHHVNKASAGKDGSANAQQAARGSGAITDNVRWQTNLSTMSEAEALTRNITDERRRWVSVDLSKVNYGPPIESRWLYRGDGGVLTGLARLPASVQVQAGAGGARKSNGHANGAALPGGRSQVPPGPDALDNQIDW